MGRIEVCFRVKQQGCSSSCQHYCPKRCCCHIPLYLLRLWHPSGWIDAAVQNSTWRKLMRSKMREVTGQLVLVKIMTILWENLQGQWPQTQSLLWVSAMRMALIKTQPAWILVLKVCQATLQNGICCLGVKWWKCSWVLPDPLLRPPLRAMAWIPPCLQLALGVLNLRAGPGEIKFISGEALGGSWSWQRARIEEWHTSPFERWKRIWSHTWFVACDVPNGLGPSCFRA